MENKRSMVLLTVIAVATLLVAVVGASFAYFTASVNTVNPENATTTVKAKTLASATMDMGSAISLTNKLPGYQAVKTISITGGGAADALPINTRLTLTPDLDYTTADSQTAYMPVKYTIYKTTTAAHNAAVEADTVNHNGVVYFTSNEVSETVPEVPAANEQSAVPGYTKYYDAGTLTTGGLTALTTGTFNGNTPVTYDITVSYNTADTYYVVIEYINNTSAEQNAEQGQTFTVTMSYAAQEYQN